MTISEANATIKRGKLPATLDWYGGFVGLFLFVSLWLASAVIVFVPTIEQNQLVAIPCFLALGALCFYGLFNLLHERQLTIVRTGLNISENNQLLIVAFQQLGWKFSPINKSLLLANIPRKPIGLGGNVTALVSENAVYLNIIGEVVYKGRLPFFSNNYDRKLHLLINTIKQQLAAI